MIQIYNASNTDYTKNGDKVLFPTACKLTAILKSDWTLTITHPFDEEGRWKYIKEGAVLSAPSFNGTQLFRIIKKKKNRTSITATAYPIFFDSAHDHILQDVRPTIKNGQEALDIMTQGSVYSGESNITTVTTAYYYFRNLMEAINGDLDQSFLNRWGGEPIYDNYKVIINERAGGDYGVEALYGKNLSSIEEEVDYTELATRLIPKAFNGHRLAGDTPWVDSSLINNFPIVYTKEVEFDKMKLAEDAEGDEEGIEIYDTLAELRSAMIEKCNALFDEGADSPAVTLNIKMIPLSQTEEYKDYEVLETVGLGDTVKCVDSVLGVSTSAKVTKIVWDCQLERLSELTIGDYKENATNSIFSTEQKVNGAIRDNGSLMAERVSGILNAMDTQLKYQKNIAQRQDVRAILFEDTDESSNTYGAMCLGTQGFQIANKRTTDGRDWAWSTFGTANGFVADLIIAGALYSSNYVQGSQGLKIDLDKGTITAPNFTVDENGNVTLTGKITSNSANITGGTFNVTTASEIYSAIQLAYSDWSAQLAPYQLRVTNSNTGNNVLVQSGGLFSYNSSGVLAAYIGSGGVYLNATDGSVIAGLNQNAIYYGSSAYSGYGLSIMGSGAIRDNLDVYGTFYAASGSIGSSDRKLKNSIEELDAEFCKDFLMALIPSSYKYNDGTSDRYHHGFIAGDVLEAMNGKDWGLYCEVTRPAITKTVVNKETGEEETIVVEEETTNAGLRYEELIAPIVKVVQYQQEKIEKLEATLDKVMAFINYSEEGGK